MLCRYDKAILEKSIASRFKCLAALEPGLHSAVIVYALLGAAVAGLVGGLTGSIVTDDFHADVGGNRSRYILTSGDYCVGISCKFGYEELRPARDVVCTFSYALRSARYKEPTVTII